MQLAALRREHAVLRETRFEGGTEVEWFGADGEPMQDDGWQDTDGPLVMKLEGPDETVLIAVNGGDDTSVALPSGDCCLTSKLARWMS